MFSILWLYLVRNNNGFHLHKSVRRTITLKRIIIIVRGCGSYFWTTFAAPFQSIFYFYSLLTTVFLGAIGRFFLLYFHWEITNKQQASHQIWRNYSRNFLLPLYSLPPLQLHYKLQTLWATTLVVSTSCCLLFFMFFIPVLNEGNHHRFSVFRRRNRFFQVGGCEVNFFYRWKDEWL